MADRVVIAPRLFRKYLWTRSVLALGILTLLAGKVVGQQARNTGPVPAIQRQQLRLVSTEHLLALLTEDSLNLNIERGVSTNYAATVAHELIQRRPYQSLFGALTHPQDDSEQQWAARILGEIRSPGADSGMRALAIADSSSVAYFAVRYFGDTGQPWALKILSENFWRYGKTAPWFYYHDLLRLFRDYKYAPATSRILEALQVDNETTFELAEEALRALFPDVHETFVGQETARDFWTRYVAKRQSIPALKRQ